MLKVRSYTGLVFVLPFLHILQLYSQFLRCHKETRLTFRHEARLGDNNPDGLAFSSLAPPHGTLTPDRILISFARAVGKFDPE